MPTTSIMSAGVASKGLPLLLFFVSFLIFTQMHAIDVRSVQFSLTVLIFSRLQQLDEHRGSKSYSTFFVIRPNTNGFNSPPSISTQHQPFRLTTTLFDPTPTISVHHHPFQPQTNLFNPKPTVSAHHHPI